MLDNRVAPLYPLSAVHSLLAAAASLMQQLPNPVPQPALSRLATVSIYALHPHVDAEIWFLTCIFSGQAGSFLGAEAEAAKG